MRINTRTRVFGAVLVVFALVAAACGSGDDASKTDGPTITIGSFGFSESEIVGEIYRLALEADGYKVEHKALLGSREAVVNPALRSGEINFVPEYIGTGLEVTFGIDPSANADETRDALDNAWAAENISVLDYTPAEDKNGIVVTAATAEKYNLAKISDLSTVAGELIFGGPPECPDRPRCLGGLGDVYGLTFGDFKALDVGGPLTVTALKGGEIDVALLFSSDGVIEAEGFVLLEDDKGLQPAENLAPIVADSVLDAYGDGFTTLVNRVSASLNQADLTELNKLVGYDGEDATEMARKWLTDNGLI
ncbi:ABC transporter, substrate-binding protein (cluster 13, osmolytes) [hydrothermal vent metagenome]|uniref:ABC transporter, substrate-binding protein (Cluster 13, osmolytes) n=1 Tax=hydrothermal vent metagenome TaxID=652676 RepID=A0A3B0SQD9_9ZZZZ